MNTQLNAITPRVILQMMIMIIFFIVITSFLPLLISRQWDWWEAWAYALVSILGFILSRALAARRNPDLLPERANSLQKADTQPWDKILAPLIGLVGILMMVVIGLDALLDWSGAFSLPVKLVALVMILAGYALGSYALIENRFFAGTVRLQTERGQQVVSSGPYRWVRHPGYAGALITYLAIPFFLDSSWALIPTLMMVIVLVVRTRLEDRFLQDELDGYREYAGRVRFRLLPGVW